MQVFNTMSRRLETVEPSEPGHIGLYTCGPTVYNYAHIGNYRAYVFEDLLRRTLKYNGFDVTQVMNLTDIDDKTIKGSQAAGVSLTDYTKPYIDAFFEDLDTLMVERAEVYPAATDHIAEMIVLIQRLFDNGYAYQSDDGSVYYDVAKFSAYGALAHLDMSGMQAGARVAQDEYEKENVADFALWKAWSEEDGDVAWESPWGRGRPGWHIECSAMGMKYLGESFDMHTGGVDNMFPHHENEIAQSQGATGQPFVTYWMHNAHLQVEGRKMSKSLGNFFTLRDLLDKGYTGHEIRYVLLSAHYRQTLNFTFAALDAARSALGRLDEFSERLTKTAAACDATALPAWAAQAADRFGAAVSSDLNVSEGLAALFEIVHEGNRALDAADLDGGAAASILEAWLRMDTVLGVLEAEKVDVDDTVAQLVQQRQEARAARDWAASDRIRDELKTHGWEVRDTPEGPELRKC